MFIIQLSPEDDQSISIETSSWNQRFFSELPQLILGIVIGVIPQTFSHIITACLFYFISYCRQIELFTHVVCTFLGVLKECYLRASIHMRVFFYFFSTEVSSTISNYYLTFEVTVRLHYCISYVVRVDKISKALDTIGSYSKQLLP